MGPRLVGRGKAGWPKPIKVTSDQLQWGRVLWDAESTQIPHRQLQKLLASMGPRLVGRGKAVDAPVPPSAIAASMGPRLVGRGKFAQPLRERHVGMLQWGRVLWDAERIYCAYIDQIRRKASMGPRLVGRGKDRIRIDWGHGPDRFNGAASCGTRKGVCFQMHYFDIHGASMGPRLVGRGKIDGVEQVVRPPILLQWGRVLWDAERRPCNLR